MSDEGWNFIEEMFSRRSSNAGRPPVWDRRTIVDAILYVVKNGVTWRDLPRDFPPWKTVYHYFRSWSLAGLWRDVSLILVEAERLAAGREESPSLASVDSQSQTAEPGVSERGLDGGKLVNGRKRHIAVDVQGLLLACYCTAANVSDVVGGEKLVLALNNKEIFPRLAKILGDNAYKAVGRTLPIAVTVENSERKHGQKGFVPAAFRWAVERTFAWLNRQRRLCRNFEKKVCHQESMNYIGNIRLCLSRISLWMK
jgi:putative transposase